MLRVRVVVFLFAGVQYPPSATAAAAAADNRGGCEHVRRERGREEKRFNDPRAGKRREERRDELLRGRERIRGEERRQQFSLSPRSLGEYRNSIATSPSSHTSLAGMYCGGTAYRASYARIFILWQLTDIAQEREGARLCRFALFPPHIVG